MFSIRYISILLILAANNPLSALGASGPVVYPDKGSIVSSPVLFFWKDDRTDPAVRSKLSFKLELSEKSGITVSRLISPVYSDGFFSFSLLSNISAGDYDYTISAFDGKNEYKNAFFGYARYPVKGSFVYNGTKESRVESSGEIIRRYCANHYNDVENKYNIYFYGAGTLIAGTVAYIAFGVLDENIITRVIGVISAGSAAAGLGLTCYYSYKYMSFDEDSPQSFQKNGERKIILSYKGSF